MYEYGRVCLCVKAIKCIKTKEPSDIKQWRNDSIKYVCFAKEPKTINKLSGVAAAPSQRMFFFFVTWGVRKKTCKEFVVSQTCCEIIFLKFAGKFLCYKIHRKREREREGALIKK